MSPVRRSENEGSENPEKNEDTGIVGEGSTDSSDSLPNVVENNSEATESNDSAGATNDVTDVTQPAATQPLKFENMRRDRNSLRRNEAPDLGEDVTEEELKASFAAKNSSDNDVTQDDTDNSLPIPFEIDEADSRSDNDSSESSAIPETAPEDDPEETLPAVDSNDSKDSSSDTAAIAPVPVNDESIKAESSDETSNDGEWDGSSLDDDYEEKTADKNTSVRSSLEHSEDDSPAYVQNGSRGSRDSGSKKKKRIALFAIAGLVVAGGATAAIVTNMNTTVPEAISPASVEIDDSKICETFEKESLDCEIKWESSPTYKRGMLLDQSIASGEKVSKDSSIVLTYSNGPISSEMPNLKNKTVDEAEAAFYDMNVTVKEIKEVPGDGTAKGHIVATDVPAGAAVENGSEIVLEVSSGKVSVPDWSGKTRDFVATDAGRLGIKVVFVEEESEQASDLVISQTPVAGEVVTDDQVNVVVSKSFESKDIQIPDVIGKSTNDAQVELAVAGFRHIKTVVVKNSEVTEPQVTQIVPGVGQTGKSEENIVIIVSEPSK